MKLGPHEREFNRRVQQKIDAGMLRSSAIQALVKEDPALHLCYLAAYNDRLGYKFGALQARKALAAL
ncbi:MAG: hypothetical protein IID34_11675 [Planctomycetes bacterium]|nr:hypothetical protein [Planctomycetota bacterium]